MFDFILQAPRDKQVQKIQDNAMLNGKEYKCFEFNYSFCNILTYSFEEKKEFWYENENGALIIYGKVFNQMHSDNLDKIPPSPADIFGAWFLGRNLLSFFKGNFTILVVDKKNESLHIINDHFAIKPLYYLKKHSGFFVSSNLNTLRLFEDNINYTAVLERLLFTYPISSDTYIKGVKFLNGGEKLEYRDFKLMTHSTFDLENFVFRETGKFSLTQAVEIFNNSVNQRANSAKYVTASLTGGFDGRAVVSALLKNKNNFNSYSFGCKGGENTLIPLQISKKIPQTNYRPFFLSNSFEDEYSQYAVEAINLSDGLSFFDRANYPYVFSKISEKSKFVLSGLLGGELLGPVNMISDYINDFYYSIFYQDKDLSWKDQLDKKPYGITPQIIKTCSSELDNRIEEKKVSIKAMKKNKNGFLYYYFDLLDLGYRRFYGSEIHIERYYAENLTPFLDYDLLDYILSTDYINIFKGSYNRNIFKRRNSKVIQATAICKNSRLLGDIRVDRNFRPRDLNRFSSRLSIPLKFYLRKLKAGRQQPDFNQFKWDKIFYSTIELGQSDIFSYYMDEPGQELNIAASLQFWLKNN